MEKKIQLANISNTIIGTSSSDGETSWSTTEMPFTPEEEEEIVTLVVVVIGVIAAIIVLFSMGIFIDCRHQKKDSMKKQKLRLKMPPLGRRRPRGEDGKSLAADMCPNGACESGLSDRDAVV